MWFVTGPLSSSAGLTISLAWGVTLGALQVNMPLVDLIVQLLAWALGATLFHSAACVWNDMCDYDLDRQVGAYIS
jgi:4-hydroxybenzoate polyprenyltransferase